MVDWSIYAIFFDGTNLETTSANSLAFKTMMRSFPLLMVFCRLMDSQLPPTPSTMLFSLEVANNFQENGSLYFSVNLQRIWMVYRFLNSELSLSVHLTSGHLDYYHQHVESSHK